jgi:hypothetical protein
MRAILLLTGAIACAVGQSAHAGVIAGWTFEVSQPSTAGPHVAEEGVNAATSFATRFHSGASIQIVNSAGNGSSYSFDTRRWSVNDYYQFTTSTQGYESITFEWDQTRTPNGPRSFKVAWSVDGVNFFDLLAYTVDNINWSPGGSPEAGSQFGPHALPTDLDDQATVYLRLISLSTGTPPGQGSKIDNVYIRGALIPQPGALALLGLAGFVVARRPRRG